MRELDDLAGLSMFCASSRKARSAGRQGARPAEIKSHSAAPSGLLRIAASVAHGQAAIAPRLLSFMRRCPAVRIDLHVQEVAST
ncbi:hypothetical protein [Sorangium sp. So ce1389]|uniref:hypothetical protein n=1 Tax=Sorangium sp. So ce1389 TaxID=3133336 RepID=UPI003F63D0D3